MIYTLLNILIEITQNLNGCNQIEKYIKKYLSKIKNNFSSLDLIKI